MVKIVQNGNPVLREIAKPVSLSTIKSASFRKVLKDMEVALSSQEDGVALAAPQIGLSLRLFIVSGRIFEKTKGDVKRSRKSDLIFINPELIRLSKKRKVMDEGCLSVRPLYGNVKRAEKATIRAYDEKGKLHEYGASGLLAQIFQHEMDHLEGILFVDKATDVLELPKEHAKVKA